MKKTVIRVGDTVKILRSRFIKRVGYPLVWMDLEEEMEKSEKVQQAYCWLTGAKYRRAPVKEDQEGWWHYEPVKMPRYFVIAAAKLEVEQRGFGGKERSLHYYEPFPRSEEGVITSLDYGKYAPNFDGQLTVVQHKKMTKTGKRFPASSGGTGGYNGDDYWDEPGGLENEKTHVLLKVGEYWIEEIDVELVKGKG